MAIVVTKRRPSAGIHIVGSSHTAFGRFDASSCKDLIVVATREELTEAGRSGADIDVIRRSHFSAGMSEGGWSPSLVLQAGRHPGQSSDR